MTAATSTVSRDYSELYQDLNQISDRIRLDQMEFSEVMLIHRMFIRLQDLDLGHLEGAERVKRLYIFADVVEVEEGGFFVGQEPVARLPGSMMVVILCRILWVRIAITSSGSALMPIRGMIIRLPHMKLRVVETGAQSSTQLQIHNVDAEAADRQYSALCIHADVIQCSIRVQMPQGPPTVLQNPLALRFFKFEPSRDSGNVVFSSESRSLVDEPVETLRVYTHMPNFIHQVPVPEAVTISPASLSSKWYYVFLRRVNSVVEREDAAEAELEPAFSLLKPNVPVPVLTDSNILLAMQTSLVIAELVEFAHPSADTVVAVGKHVEWLNKLLLQATSKEVEAEISSPYDIEQYRALLFRVQYLMKVVPGRRHSLVVPQLQYDVYSNLINRMAQVAESYDQSLRQLKLFIDQNRILGSYVLEQNRAFADRERDMDVFHSELMSQRKTELEGTLMRMDQLSIQMETQQAYMMQAQENMEQELARWQNRQVARAMFSVLIAVASIGLAFVTGGATAPAAVGAAKAAVTAAGVLQRVVEILESLQQVMEVVSLIKELVSSLQNIGQLVEAPEMPDMPTDADWVIFVNEVELVAEQMPADLSEVSAWKAKCKNVAALGREMVTMAAYISQLQYEIQVQSMLQEIATRHADRLSSIQVADLRNYTEMVTQMDMRTTRLLVGLIKVVHMQNAALMYQSLSPPTYVNAWPVTMDTVWRMLVQHEHAAVLGLMRLGPSFDFMRTYVVDGIPVQLLIDGEDWEFEIPVEEYTAFPLTWSRVRIHHIEMKFVEGAHVHQPRTETGKVYMLLQGSRMFHDRNQMEVIHYEAAMPLDYHYAYRLDTGETTLSNLPSHEFITTFMRMTPFTNWRLRLSASAEENKGLHFPTATALDATTQIAITYYVSAIRRISL